MSQSHHDRGNKGADQSVFLEGAWDIMKKDSKNRQEITVENVFYFWFYQKHNVPLTTRML